MKRFPSICTAGYSGAMLALSFFSCTNNSSPVGSSLYPPNNQLAFKTLDSNDPADSLSISFSTETVHLSTAPAFNALAGVYRSYEARVLLQFAPIVDTAFVRDTLPAAAIQSAYLQLHLAGYRFGDTSAAMRFNCTMNEVLTAYESGATWDSLGASSNYSSTPVGSFSGTIGLNDSVLDIPLDTAFVMRLLRYSAYDSLAANFHGLALLPQSGTSGIVSFRNSSAVIHLVFKSDSARDTTVLTAFQNFFIANGSEPDPPGEMTMQSGLVKRLHLTVNYPYIPKLATINAALLQLTLDTMNSMFGRLYLRDSTVLRSRDTMFLYMATGDSLGTYNIMGTRTPNTNVYTFPQAAVFMQLWLRGAANNGVIALQGFASAHAAGDEFATLDKFVFYSPSAADSALRPRVKIFYSTESP